MSVSHQLPKPIAACAVLACCLLAAPAAHADYIAAGRDAEGDATDPSAGRDITVAALGYDRRTGTVRGGVALRGAPTDGSRAFVSVSAGVRTPTGCDGYPAFNLSSFTTDPVVRWTRFDAPGPPAAAGDAEKGEAAGELQKFEVVDPALAGRAVDCITAVVTDPADPRNVYDSAGSFTFEPLPELGAELGRTPSGLTPGRTRTIRLTLRNPGDAATGRIRLSVERKRGLTARFSRKVKSLNAGQRRTVRIKVSLSGRAKTATPLRVTATAGKLRVRQQATLYLRKPPEGGGDSGSGVCAGYAPVFGGVGEIVTYPC